MITIGPASAATVGATQTEHDEPAPGAAQVDAEQALGDAGAHPLARLARNDLHPAVQSFAQLAPGNGGDAATLLAPSAPQAAHPGGPHGRATPLYQGQQPPLAGKGQPLTAPPPAIPGAPIDVKRMEALNKIVQSYKVNRSP
ncbi:MAG TPA: hypothetical protein VFR86_27975, partial [Burkholderiaceae bacterium]|nr:hypothetical protein [Burkholderiaceae bacterium]